jgi:hypothetical protein
VNATTLMAAPPSHTCTDLDTNEPTMRFRVCAEDGAPALVGDDPAGHAISPRPAWVHGRPAAFPAPTN